MAEYENDIILHNPLYVDVIVDGQLVTGFSDGSFIEVTHADDRVAVKRGAKGATGYAVNANRGVNIKLTLMSFCSSAKMIYDLAERAIPFPMSIRDSNDANKLLMSNDNCMVTKYPDFKVGATDLEDAECEIYMPNPNMQ